MWYDFATLITDYNLIIPSRAMVASLSSNLNNSTHLDHSTAEHSTNTATEIDNNSHPITYQQIQSIVADYFAIMDKQVFGSLNSKV